MTAAFDLQTMLGTFEEGSENKIQQIPVENLIPYHNHNSNFIPENERRIWRKAFVKTGF